MNIDVDTIQPDDLFAVSLVEMPFYDEDYFGDDDDTPALNVIRVAKGRDGLARAMGQLVEEWTMHKPPSHLETITMVAELDNHISEQAKLLVADEAKLGRGNSIDRRIIDERVRSRRAGMDNLFQWKETLEFLERWVVGHTDALTWTEKVANDPFMDHHSVLDGLEYEDRLPPLTGGEKDDLGVLIYRALMEIVGSMFDYQFTVTKVNIVS